MFANNFLFDIFFLLKIISDTHFKIFLHEKRVFKLYKKKKKLPIKTYNDWLLVQVFS